MPERRIIGKTILVSMIIFLISSTVSISNNNDSHNAIANPLIIDYLTHGAFLPINFTHGIDMQKAEVLFNIDAHKKNRTTFIDYKGNYTFYNPNVTQSLIIAAPFGYDLYEVDNRISVHVNQVKTDFSIVEFFYDSENYSLYLPYYSYLNAIVCNITFQENETTNVLYEFQSLPYSIGYDTTNIHYIVGTANSWNNNSEIYEMVEFRVTGFQPKGYSVNCSVSKIPDGKSYLWNWENEKIDVTAVGITYYHRSIHPVALIIIIATTVPISITIAIVVTVKLVKKYKKK